MRAPQRCRGEPRFAGGRRRPSRRRSHLLVRRRVPRGAGSLGTCAASVPSRSRRGSGLSLRIGSRRRHNVLLGVGVMASRRGRSRDFTYRPNADADGGPRPCRHARVWKIGRGLVRIDAGRPARAAPNARLAREHDLPMWRAFGMFLQGWVTAASGAPADGLEDMRRADRGAPGFRLRTTRSLQERMDEAAKKVASVKNMAHDSGAARGFDITFPRWQQTARGASLRLFRAGNGMVALARAPLLPESISIGALSAVERNRSRGRGGKGRPSGRAGLGGDGWWAKAPLSAPAQGCGEMSSCACRSRPRG
jgi:hypothetical protein